MKVRMASRGNAARPGRGGASRAPEGESWEGVLSVHPRGFGFVASAGKDDVFIAPEAISGAMHGDRVSISVTGRTARGAEGRIEAIVRRRSPRIAGILRKRRQSSWLEPDDARIRGPIVLREPPKAGKDGDAAIVTITRFPQHAGENPEGELVSVLGPPGDANVEVAKILLREQVEEKHSLEAMNEAEAMAARLLKKDAPGRQDLRGVSFLTIDPEDARDHDDAVFAERNGDGYRVWVAIADVSEYVQPGTALDKEALARGCTIYLPDRALPMLPAALAADVCSLLPEVERLCLCVRADMDDEGTVTRFDVCEGRMRAAAMLTYGSVARTLGFTEAPPRSPQAEAFKKDLRVLDEVARRLRKVRMHRGALDFDLPEPKIALDEKTGKPTGVKRRAEDAGVKRAYQMIEELMILANELVAQWLGHRKSPAVYRVHGKPDPKKLQRLASVCERLSVPFDLEAVQEPDGIAKWLKKIARHPKKSILETLLLRSMKQATYDIINIGHFGLASTAYAHFTSPIRRYPDVEVHRAVKRLLRGEKPDTSPGAVELLAQGATASSVRERAAMEVEREVVDLYRALYMLDHIGDEFEGTVTAVTGGGIYVALDDPFVDVLVRYESLGPDQYEVDEDEIGVVGRRSGEVVNLGDRLRLTIEDVALMRRSILGRRVVPEALLKQLKSAGEGDAGRPRTPRGERPPGRETAPGRGRNEPRSSGGQRGGAAPRAPGRNAANGQRSGGSAQSGQRAGGSGKKKRRR